MYDTRVSLTPFTLKRGGLIAVRFVQGNTSSAMSLNVNSLGAVNVTYRNTTSLQTNWVPTNYVGLFQYDGTNWVFLNPAMISKPSSATEGDIATFTATGDLVDSAIKSSLLVTGVDSASPEPGVFQVNFQGQIKDLALASSVLSKISMNTQIPPISGASYPYTYNHPLNGVLATDDPIIDLYNPSQATLDDWARVLKVVANDNSLAITVTEATTTTIDIKLMILR